jgi:hypothetical protein
MVVRSRGWLSVLAVEKGAGGVEAQVQAVAGNLVGANLQAGAVEGEEAFV